VFGGAWYTALYLSNTTNSPVSVPVSFIDNFGVPLDVPLNGIGTSIFQFVDLDPGATAILEAPNSGAPGQGWVEAGFAPGVTGYGVYRQVIPGREKQEAVVPLTSESSLTADLIYDEIVSTTSVALLNPSDQQVIVTITAYSVNGAQVGSTQVTLSPQSKVATTLKTLLGGIVGNRGWATFSVSNGAVSVLGMRFLGEAFTSIPVAQR
jgi:hypothetical protein